MLSHIDENGGCYAQERTPIPKYKRRKIFAIRDFPYECGHNRKPLNVKPIGHSSADHGDQKLTNATKDKSNLDIHNVAVHEFPISKDFELELTKCPNEAIFDSSVVNPSLPSVLNFPLQPEKSTLNFNILVKNLGRKYPPRRRISAIHDFPLPCRRDAPHLTKDECIKARAFSKCSSLSCVKVENKDVKLNQSVKLSSLESEAGSKAKGDVGCKHEHLPALNLGDKSLDECLSADVNELHDMSSPFCENTDKNSVGTPTKCILPCKGCNYRVAESESGNNMIFNLKLGEIGGDVGKDIVVYEAENRSSDQILENGVGVCDAEMFDVDDRMCREIVVHLDDSGSRRQRQNIYDNSATRVIVHELMAGPYSKKTVLHKEDKHLRSEHSRSHEINDRVTVNTLMAAPRSEEIVDQLEDKYLRREYSSEIIVNNVVVYALMAAPKCPWRLMKVANLSSHSSIQKSRGLQVGPRRSKTKIKVKKLFEERRAMIASLKRKKASTNYIEDMPLRSSYPYVNALNGERDELDSWEQDEGCDDLYLSHSAHDIYVSPVVPNSAKMQKDLNDRVSHSKVRETLRLFQAVFRKLMHEGEAISRRRATGWKRVDHITAKILKDQGKYLNTGKQIVGPVPGVDIGLEFQFRVELAIVGLHPQRHAGVDYMEQGGTLIATSIVASVGYADDMDSSDILIYSEPGEFPIIGDKKAEDQKLERGILALQNSIGAKNPVRVIRGLDHKIKADSSDGKARMVKTYAYDGVYVVTKCWQEPGPNGNFVFMFRLERIPGQPELSWNLIKKSNKYKVRHGAFVADISEGRELIPICAVNTIDDQKPPSFKYITSMLYPDWCRPLPLMGCNCVNGCSESANCACALRNGGEIPFNNNGSIVEVKPLVYECGPSCKCPPSCNNRVSQYGIRFKLEIFKTESRGWGVRSIDYIPSGSFICEYLGELLEDKQAEQRINSDEYLFDIGSNFSDPSLLDELSNIMPHPQIDPSEVVDHVGFTIDAKRYGNVGRFINHSCSPNLYAQNVLYDHENRKIPHVMLFAAENIHPLQELSYHYNYNIGEVLDVDGNVKIKQCFCGSAECTGRLY